MSINKRHVYFKSFSSSQDFGRWSSMALINTNSRSGFYQLLNRLQILSPSWPVLTLWRKNIRSFQAVCSRIFQINTETSKFPSSQLIWRCCCFWFSCHPIFIISSHILGRLGKRVFINIVNNRSALFSPVTPMEVRTLTGNFQKLLAQVFFF